MSNQDPALSSTEPPALLEITSLCLDAGDGNKSLELEEPLRFTGPSLALEGEAKTILKALLQPLVSSPGDSRSLSLLGEAPASLLAAGRAGVVPEKLPLPPGYKVLDALNLSGSLIGAGKSDVMAALGRCHGTKLAKKRLGDLTPLQTRLVSLAHGTLSNPECLLIEDPYDQLDDGESEIIESLLEIELEGRSWIATSVVDSPWSRRLTSRAGFLLSSSKTHLVGPIRSSEVRGAGLWVRCGSQADSLAEALSESGARVIRSPSSRALLVSGATGLKVLDLALQTRAEVLELSPTSRASADEEAWEAPE